MTMDLRNPEPYRFSRYLLEIRWFAAVSAAIFVLGMALIWFVPSIVSNLSAAVDQTIADVLSAVHGLPPIALFALIFLNNTLKTFVFMYAGLLFGVLPAAFLFANGAVLGIVAARSTEIVGPWVTIASIVPHGAFELTAVLLGAAVGLRLGTLLLLRLRTGPLAFKPHLAAAGKFFLTFVAPLLAVAAAIEIWVTPSLIALFRVPTGSP